MKTIPYSPIDEKIAERLGRILPDLTSEELQNAQLETIREMLARIKSESIFYKELLKDIDPEEIRSFSDFRTLPVTTEKDLAGNENVFQCVSPKDVQRIITVPTTGTHGKQKRLAFTLSDLKLALDFSYIAFTTFCEDGDRILVFMSGNTPGGVGDSIRRSLEPLNAETHVYGAVENIPDAFEFMVSYAPDIIVGIPCQIAALAEYGRENGRNFTVRNVLLSSDDVPDSICERVKKIWKCEPFRHFGMTELCLMGGCECHGHCGYHFRNLDHLIEIIDPDEEGYGELAVTTFSHQAMPLLRYKTGDIAKIGTSECVCGGRFPRIENVKGRLSNSFLTGGKRVFLRDIEEIIFSCDRVIDFECMLRNRTLEVEIRTLPGASADTALLSDIRNSLEKLIEDDISIEITSSEMTGFNLGYNAKKTLN